MKAISAELFRKAQKAELFGSAGNEVSVRKLKQKGISAVIATIMLLMVSVAMIGVFYAFSSTMTGTTTGAGEEQVTQLTSQISSCMRIENINGNKVDLKNCGKGVIDSKSLSVTMDDVKLNASLQTISEDSSGTVNVTGLWQIQPGKHNLKISNGATFAQALVDVQPNKEGLAGSWNFESVDASNYTLDSSGNGNNGKLVNYSCNPAECGLADGKIGNGLQFDGVNDYTLLDKDVSVDSNNWFISWFMKRSVNDYETIFSRSTNQASGQIEVNTNNIRVESYTNNIWQYSFPSGITVADNNWHYYSLRFDATGSYLYVDGNLKSTATPNTDASNFVIRYVGHNQTAFAYYGDYFTGQLDDVRIWSRVLSPDEAVTMKQLI